MRTLSLKQTVIAGAIAVAAATAALGVVAAQQAPATNQPPAAQSGRGPNAQAGAWQAQREKFLAAVAAKLNVKPEQLEQAMKAAREEMGWGSRAPGGPGGSGAHGPGGSGGPGGPATHGPGADGPFGATLETAAKALDLPVDDLRKELQGGKSIADVAKARKVDLKTVTDALKQQANERLDQAVKDGKLPAERAAEMKKNLADRIDQVVNRSMPTGPGDRRGPPRPQGQRT